MCLFNFPNKASGKAFSKGIEEFECGHCPECLQKKSRKWALRCAMEAKVSPGVMVTLTYDTYKVINGKLSEYQENPIDPNMQLSKRDCQLFIKRLRKHFEPLKIKYLLTAERGKKGRAHYHALIFGVQFNDLVRYKKSDRGNWIYKSQTLTKLWSHGICTVDCINLSAKTARYCTKYCSKDSGAEETFMLFSRGIGDQKLLELFNGKSYWIDGREYSIPKQIWQKVIEKRYNCKGYSKYVGKEHLELVEKRVYNKLNKYEKRYSDEAIELLRVKLLKTEERLERAGRRNVKSFNYWVDIYFKRLKEYERVRSTPYHCLRGRVWHRARRQLEQSEEKYNQAKFKREIFENYRDNDPQYISYLEYWKEKNRVAELTRPSVDQRILSLPDNKYRSYKVKAIQAKHKQYHYYFEERLPFKNVEYIENGRKNIEWVPDYDNRYYIKRTDPLPFIPPRSNCQGFLPSRMKEKKDYKEKSFAPLSRHYRANDTAGRRFKNIVDHILYMQAEKERSERIKRGDSMEFLNYKPFH